MVIGKLSTRLDWVVEIPATLLTLFPWAHGEYSSGCEFYTRGGGPIHDTGRKGSSCMGNSSGPHACELGLPCKVKKLDSNRSLLAVNETA